MYHDFQPPKKRRRFISSGFRRQNADATSCHRNIPFAMNSRNHCACSVVIWMVDTGGIWWNENDSRENCKDHMQSTSYESPEFNNHTKKRCNWEELFWKLAMIVKNKWKHWSTGEIANTVIWIKIRQLCALETRWRIENKKTGILGHLTWTKKAMFESLF